MYALFFFIWCNLNLYVFNKMTVGFGNVRLMEVNVLIVFEDNALFFLDVSYYVKEKQHESQCFCIFEVVTCQTVISKHVTLC